MQKLIPLLLGLLPVLATAQSYDQYPRARDYNCRVCHEIEVKDVPPDARLHYRKSTETRLHQQEAALPSSLPTMNFPVKSTSGQSTARPQVPPLPARPVEPAYAPPIRG
ncbi:MAG: hypothetical protein RIR00_2496 [Pseudomonadota bacterium]